MIPGWQPPHKSRSYNLIFRVTREELQRIKDRAAAQGLNVSEYARLVILNSKMHLEVR